MSRVVCARHWQKPLPDQPRQWTSCGRSAIVGAPKLNLMETGVTILSGPISGGAHGWAFGASLGDLAAVGYIESEFFLTGEAARYTLAGGSDYAFDGVWAVEKRGTLPFRTRLLVRRPADPGRFNGTVVVNWNNVSIGHENLPGMSTELFEAGFAWVGASVQRVGLEGFPFGEPRGLVAWDPERYGTLSIPDDDLSYDIFTQVAAAVGPARVAQPPDPMGGLTVRRLLAFGASQSACRLATYYNSVQLLSQAFDGFLLVVYPGGGSLVDSTQPGPELDEIPAAARTLVNLLPFSSHVLRTDLDAPVLVLNSETEAPWYHAVRQADSDTYRLWEIPGTAHASSGGAKEATALQERDFGTVPPGLSLPADANPNTLSFAPVAEAALHHMQRWISGGPPPPPQPRVEFSGDPPTVVRDEHGNAVGGIRLPQLAAATGSHRGASPKGVPDLTGSSTPFEAETLRKLYPHRDVYLARFEAAVRHGLEQGFLLPRDAERLRTQAAAAQIP